MTLFDCSKSHGLPRVSPIPLEATTPPPAEWNVPHDGPIDKSFSVTAAPELTKKAAEKDDDDDEDEEEEEEEVQHPDFLSTLGSTFQHISKCYPGSKRRATRLAGHFLGCSSSFSPLIY